MIHLLHDLLNAQLAIRMSWAVSSRDTQVRLRSLSFNQYWQQITKRLGFGKSNGHWQSSAYASRLKRSNEMERLQAVKPGWAVGRLEMAEPQSAVLIGSPDERPGIWVRLDSLGWDAYGYMLR